MPPKPGKYSPSLRAGEREKTLVSGRKIAFPEVDFVNVRAAKAYRVKVAKVKAKGERQAFAVVALDLDRDLSERENHRLSEWFGTPAEAWSVFVHGFSVRGDGVNSGITKLVDCLLASGDTVELE